MANEERKVRYGIKGKLVSAIAMLLVAAIMTVSSTYAWFTLSTAPEVSGISTAVGANGALEMALLVDNGDGTWGYETVNGANGDRNTTWGNLVDLSDPKYGTDKIVLYPAQLNTSLGNKINMDSPLNYPTYGTDGRVNAVDGTTMLSGSYNNGFYANDKYGFRAVGATSGLSARQIALRAATSQINVLKSQAQGKAEASLTTHGADLADMAIQKVLVDVPLFGKNHYNAVAGMIDGLEEALALLDEAYQQAVLAWAASNATSSEDIVYNAVKAIVEDNTNNPNIEAVVAAVVGKFTEWQNTIKDLTGEEVPLSLPAWILGAPAAGDTAATYLEQYKVMKADVETAATRLAALLNDTNSTTVDDVKTPNDNAEFTYAEMTNALQPLVNLESLTVNDLPLSDKSGIMSSAFANYAVWVSMTSGTGVYADVADQCGSYKASIKVNAGELVGIEDEEILLDAEMRATTTISNPYLKDIVDEAKGVGAPADAAGESPFSEFYGYIVDLAFRTNAASSNLLLQQQGIDRIYSDNNNESTMGKGSTMTFSSLNTASFSTEKVKDLMRHIRIVFFQTDGEHEIYAYAKLDVDNATVANGQVTAMMYIYETVTAYTADVNMTVYKDDNNKYYLDSAKTKEVTIVEDSYDEGTGKATVKNMTVFRGEPETVTTGEGENAQTTTTYSYYTDYYTQDDTTFISSTTDAAVNAQILANPKQVEVARNAEDENFGVITALTQNAEKHVSALVYLDGETIQNSDVAAEAAQSMTGTANFQFASDANLVPMEYGNLHTPNANTPANP